MAVVIILAALCEMERSLAHRAETVALCERSAWDAMTATSLLLNYGRPVAFTIERTAAGDVVRVDGQVVGIRERTR